MLSGRAKVAGVIGWPVSHSRSPRLHGYWLDRYAIDGAYVPFGIPPERLGAVLRALPTLGIAGVNVTIPHKEAAAALVDTLDHAAERIGAINTIVVRDDGNLVGSNSDGFGFMACLYEGAPAWQPGNGPAAVIGAGGAARAVAAALLSAG
ncbi:MAG: shikimate dehydrogenase, partial [Alphaproteobacteria bacterium]|nr:shikimate dehydrogenase [Alphaproteobacteria bacterium]